MNLKVGDRAPDFVGTYENGQKMSLADFTGKKVVLFFYPKDMTLNCTIEACNLRDNYFDLLYKGIQLIGISADDEQKHEQFRTKYDLPFPLIADTDKKITNAYGVWGRKSFFGIPFEGIQRTTFIINEEGIIEAIIDKVKPRSHSSQILEVMND